MYNADSRQFIFKQSNDKIWDFFYDERDGLCYSTLTKRSVWTEPVSLVKKLQKSFYLDMDFDDVFHILFQDTQGNLFYSRLDNQGSSTKPVLSSKNPTPYDKHLFLIPLKNHINIFYVIEHNENVMLAHQSIINGTLGTPKVIDYVANKKHPYTATYDKSGTIYVFYQSSDGKHLQLGYKKYAADQKSWSEFIPVTKYSGNCESPGVIADSNNIMHLCYQRSSNRQYELVYKQKVPDKNSWTDEVVIHSSMYPYENPSIAAVNGKLIIYWVRDDIIFHSISSNDGNTWTKPARYSFAMGKQLFCMSFKSNAAHEYEKVIAPYIPGSFINGLKLAFYHDVLSTSSSNLSAEELKNMLFDSLKYLKTSVEELKESDTAADDSISKITSLQHNMEKELIKYSVKLNSIESEINQLRSIANKLENLYSTLSNAQNLQAKSSIDKINVEALKSEIISCIFENDRLEKIDQETTRLHQELNEIKQMKIENSSIETLKNEILSYYLQHEDIRKLSRDIANIRRDMAELREEIRYINLRLNEENEEE